MTKLIDVNIEFTKGILFVRLCGILDEVNSYNVEKRVFDVVKEGGIRYVVFNIKDVIIKEKVTLFDRCEKLLIDNDGRMLICGNKIGAYNLVSDELSALKLLNA